jgi:tripartite-type tricarboxylate transporter receptor subunit TctC
MLGKLMTVIALALAAASMPAAAAFPDHAVKLIVSNAPGGPVDIMSRMLADQLSKKWGQSVVVENRPGASGIISTNLLAHANPDGHTLGVVVASTLTIVPHATSSLPFDPLKDLQPITMSLWSARTARSRAGMTLSP